MIEAILNPAFTGADLGLVLIALTAAYAGQRFDRIRNERRQAEIEAAE